MKRLAALAVLLVVLAAPACSGLDEAAGDYATALRELRPLAMQGDAEAQLNLGFMYSKGRGVPQDYVQAYMWFNLAGAQGHKKAAENRDMVAALMTPAQIADAQRRAGKWRPRR